MRFIAEPFTQHRLQRFYRWAMLWLTWFAGFLDAASQFAPLAQSARTIAHLWLDRVERMVLAIVMLRAVRLVRGAQTRRGVAEHCRKERGLSRAVVGSSLRHALRSRDLRQRIERLRQDVDVLVARLLRRLPRGLTRRRPINARRDFSPIDAFLGAQYPDAVSDTS
jgi:hypothetical protein